MSDCVVPKRILGDLISAFSSSEAGWFGFSKLGYVSFLRNDGPSRKSLIFVVSSGIISLDAASAGLIRVGM